MKDDLLKTLFFPDVSVSLPETLLCSEKGDCGHIVVYGKHFDRQQWDNWTAANDTVTGLVWFSLKFELNLNVFRWMWILWAENGANFRNSQESKVATSYLEKMLQIHSLNLSSPCNTNYTFTYAIFIIIIIIRVIYCRGKFDTVKKAKTNQLS